MTVVDLRSRLGGVVPPGRVRADVPLAPLTTFRVGGPADWLVDVGSEAELTATMGAARAAGLPVTILGGGTNVLVADAGVRGVVIRVRLTGVSQPGPDVVRAEAGLTMNGLVRWTIGRGLAALESWAGTPGTVGGAIRGNAHFGGRNIGDLVSGVRLATAAGEVVDRAATEMGFAYDTSRLQRTGDVLVSADFGVKAGEVGALRGAARAALAYRKQTQPLALSTAGCVFQNPDPARDAVPDSVPASAGALVDRAGLKGLRVGGALISTVHANFVVNDGTATARDVREVIETARARVLDRFGVALRDEVVFLGQF